MVYQLSGEHGKRSLSGYNEWSLSVFNVSDFQPQSVPDPGITDDTFGNVTECRCVYSSSHVLQRHHINYTPGFYRYKDFRHPPGSEDEYDYTATHWHVFCARLAFVIVFEVSNVIFKVFLNQSYLSAA